MINNKIISIIENYFDSDIKENILRTYTFLEEIGFAPKSENLIKFMDGESICFNFICNKNGQATIDFYIDGEIILASSIRKDPFLYVIPKIWEFKKFDEFEIFNVIKKITMMI